jgi:hypothetical protein
MSDVRDHPETLALHFGAPTPTVGAPVSREKSTFRGLPALSNTMRTVRLQCKHSADLRRVQCWMHNEQLHIEPFRRVSWGEIRWPLLRHSELHGSTAGASTT